MQFEDFCMRARLLRTVEGRAHFVCLINGMYSVRQNPPNWDCIKYTATAPQQHPSES